MSFNCRNVEIEGLQFIFVETYICRLASGSMPQLGSSIQEIFIRQRQSSVDISSMYVKHMLCPHKSTHLGERLVGLR